MQTHYLKRFEVEKMFSKTNEYLNESFNDENAEPEETEETSFFVLKRMHACVKATPVSIEFFFSHIYRIRTFRTKLFKKLLIYSIKSSFLRKWLINKNYVTDYHQLTKKYNQNWKNIDILFAEWDFIGVFFKDQSIVTHILYDPNYYYKLKNEIEARQELKGIINIPSILDYNLSKVGWYQDKLSVSENGHIISKKDFEDAQVQLTKVINYTSKEINLLEYLEQLNKKAALFFHNSTTILTQIQTLINYIKSYQNTNATQNIILARCHGDFNKNQLLKKDGEVFIIDWAESEQNIIWHDLVYNFIYHTEETKNIDWNFIEKLAPILFSHIEKAVKDSLSDDLVIAIILIEVALKQHAAFNKNRGYLSTWSKLIKTFES